MSFFSGAQSSRECIRVAPEFQLRRCISGRGSACLDRHMDIDRAGVGKFEWEDHVLSGLSRILQANQHEMSALRFKHHRASCSDRQSTLKLVHLHDAVRRRGHLAHLD